MLTKVISSALMGIEGYPVEVEADISQGLPSFDIVGLPDSTVKESKNRVVTAIKNCEIAMPVKKITVNLAPADIRKEGAHFDLPIAIGLLCSIGVIESENIKDSLFIGELSLDGAVRPAHGVLPMVYDMFQNGTKKFYVPFENLEEACLVEGAIVYGIKSLNEIIKFLNGLVNIEDGLGNEKKDKYLEEEVTYPDFADVKGQENVKRALEISAAGMHNILMIGPPGSGKTMMAKRIPGIMPKLSFSAGMEITKIQSVVGKLKDKSCFVKTRPFRAPHHTISDSALIGGGRIPRPGEISLAHRGVLFLDELPEFHKNVLEVLRQPLEERKVTISRVNGTVSYPAAFMLVAAMNPCPCGYYGDERCTCSQNEISRYLNKISGPLLDRIDIHVEAAAVNYKDIKDSKVSESSEEIRKRVVLAQKIQIARYKNNGISFNSELTPGLVEKYCTLDSSGEKILKSAFVNLNFSVRAYHKILKIARTIADLESSADISAINVAEALQYRNLDRKFWG